MDGAHLYTKPRHPCLSLSLKDTYDPELNYEDFLIEDILQRAYGDGLIDLDPTALTYDLDSLYTLWKAPKTPLSED